MFYLCLCFTSVLYMIWYVPTAVVDHEMVNRVALSLFLNVRVWVYCRRCRRFGCTAVDVGSPCRSMRLKYLRYEPNKKKPTRTAILFCVIGVTVYTVHTLGQAYIL